MKRQLSVYLTLFVMLFAVSAFAQTRSVSGNVTDANGDAAIAATVKVTGTETGTVTDLNGDFTLEVPADAETLTISYVGMESQVVEISDNMNVSLELGDNFLDEIVITASGARQKERLNYAVQTVDEEQINQTPVTDVTDALAGKVSGLQVFGNSAATFNDSETRLRGVNGGIGGSAAVYVVDGVIVPNQNSIDPNTIESINVLKGGSATALYGIRASGGAIVITTKRGRDQGAFNLTSSFGSSEVSRFFDYQTEYGGGYSQNFNVFEFNPAIHPESWASFDGQMMPEYYADESWGPRLDGQMVRHWDSWIPGGENFGQLRPWELGGTPYDYFETPATFDNALTFSKGGDDYSIVASYRNNTRDGLLPNSGQDRNYVTLNTSFDVRDNVTLRASGRYNTAVTDNDPTEGYGSVGSNFSQWWQMNVDFDRLERYAKNPDGTTNSWNINGPTDVTPLYWNNPYYIANESRSQQRSNRIIGNIALDFEPVKDLFIVPSISLYRNEFQSNTNFPSGALEQDSFSQNNQLTDELTYSLRGSYYKKLSDMFNFEVTAAGEIFNRKGNGFAQGTTGGLTIPGFYAITGETDANVGQFYRRQKIESLFGFVNLGLFDDLLFLEGTLRSDWTSTIAEENNPIVTPSVGGSFVFSELMNSDIVDFGKLRLSWANRLQDIDEFLTNPAYSAGTAYGSSATLFVPGTLANPALQGGTYEQLEAGLGMTFFENRLGFDASYYNIINKDFVVDIDVDPTSGYNNAVVNNGKMTTQGWDIELNGKPVQTDNVTWELFANLGNATTTVDELAEGIDNYQFARFAFVGTPDLDINAREGEEWGAIYGRSRTFDDQGRPYLTSGGNWVTSNRERLGTAQADLIGGLVSNLKWKNFTLFASSDFRFGGQFFSISEMFSAYSGLGSNTVGNNSLGNPVRDDVKNSAGEVVTVVAASDAHPDSGGILMEGVDPDTGQEVSYYKNALNYYGGYGSGFWVNDLWMNDADYIKLRDIRLNYDLPSNIFNGTNALGMKGASVGLFASNVGLIWSKAENIDPSELENYRSGDNTLRWLDGGQFPSARTIGVNLRLNF